MALSIAVAVSALIGLICFYVSEQNAKKLGIRKEKLNVFNYALAGFALAAVNLLILFTYIYFIDAISLQMKRNFDFLTFLIWLPLMLILWFPLGKIIQILRK